MAGESIRGYTAFQEVTAAASMADGAFSSGAMTRLNAALTGANEADYLLLDFKLVISVGTPVENGRFDLFRIAGDGVDDSPTPAGAYLQKPLASFMLDDVAAGKYFLRGFPNEDPNDRFIIQNNSGAILTAQLLVRTRYAKVA